MNILFIEDDPMNRRVVKDMLDVAGATMAEAAWAEEGLARIDSETFDIVLVDLRMPGTDGFETIRQIRARTDAKAGLPIIVVTADTAGG
ncbi:response regulator, partial [Sphingomonas elodea]|uniref:response regulator n=1 Tax=Sphingomonas elodea TaxID=179878 RepID=UPI00026313B4